MGNGGRHGDAEAWKRRGEGSIIRGWGAEQLRRRLHVARAISQGVSRSRASVCRVCAQTQSEDGETETAKYHITQKD